MITKATNPPEESATSGTESIIDKQATGSNSQILPDVDIKEKMFIAQTNDIYMRPEDYIGKIIRYEGMFVGFQYDESLPPVYMVYRFGPGCCGYDGIAGFEVSWEGSLPKENDWVEAIGTLGTYEENGVEYLRIELSSLKVMETRGAETVMQ